MYTRTPGLAPLSTRSYLIVPMAQCHLLKPAVSHPLSDLLGDWPPAWADASWPDLSTESDDPFLGVRLQVFRSISTPMSSRHLRIALPRSPKAYLSSQSASQTTMNLQRRLTNSYKPRFSKWPPSER